MTQAIRERSMQQLDPLDGLASRPLTVLAAVLVPVLVIGLTVLDFEPGQSRVLLAVAVLVLCVSSVVLIRASRALHAPFTARAHWTIVALVLLASAIEVLAKTGSNDYVSDDWGPFVIGIALASMSPYRPTRELVASGVFAAAVVALLAFTRVEGYVTGAPPLVYSVIAALPVLAFGVAGAAFTAASVSVRERSRATLAWASRAGMQQAELREPVATSVEHDSRRYLGRGVVPLLSSVVARGRIDQADAQQATDLARQIRADMVADANLSWIHRTVAELSRGVQPISPTRVSDDAGLTNHLTFGQRTAVRALFAELFDHAAFDASTFRVHVAPANEAHPRHYELLGESPPAEVRIDLRPTGHGFDGWWQMRSLRTALGPYLAVMQVVFSSLEVDIQRMNLTVKFQYEQQ